MGTGRPHRRYARSHLFLVRIWRQTALDGDGESDWHGQVQRPVDGENHRFSDWPALIELLNSMMAAEERRAKPGYHSPESETK
jgi:hypothetical protein